jgi:histone deacetylase 1/2
LNLPIHRDTIRESKDNMSTSVASMDGSLEKDAHTGSSKRRVAYFYDAEIGNFHYGQRHPMKVHRKK